MVAHHPSDATQGSLVQLVDQKHVVRYVELAADTVSRPGPEAKAWVIRGVTDEDHCRDAAIAASLESFQHEARSDPLALPFRHDGQRPESHKREIWSIHQRHWGEQDVPDDRPGVLGNEGNEWRDPFPQGINEIGFRTGFEGGQIDGSHALRVRPPLVANVH